MEQEESNLDAVMPDGPIDYETTDQILAIAFGEVEVQFGCVLAEFRVRTYEDMGPIKNMPVEGSRSGVLIHHQVITQIMEHTPALLDLMKDMGADKDLLPHAKGPVPMWNAGPSIKSCNGLFHVCEGFGFTEPVPELGAVVAWIETRMLVNPRVQAYGGNYLMSYPVLVEFLESLPKVLRRMESKGAVKPT